MFRFEQAYAPCDYVFVDRQSRTTSAAEHLVSEVYLKLMPKRYYSYRLLSFGPEYLNYLQERIESSVNINRDTLETHERDFSHHPLSGSTEASEIHRELATKLQNKTVGLYAVELIICNVTTKAEPRYIASLYSYSSNDDFVGHPK